MAERCSAAWDTELDDDDGDGEAEHNCFLDDGHPEEYHFCADHFACAPVFGTPSWDIADAAE